ncbi:putative 2-aminoethylphosphonate ABC transporter ATP-binding protein [Paracoccus pacificus]|uniref:2-aminoethylphosphonate ABC transporter ATP-binding protein n=1 Tax=Paracoccus pacificus TaxID=1463598 RepID=A0ABW4R978_9RHOB
MPSAPVKPDSYLEISDLWKSFGDFVALRNISLDVARGEFICFLGPSGCGKTTLLRAIAGLDPQSRGTIHQDGRDISRLPASRRDYGIVFQSYALFPNLTVTRNIAFGLENTGRPRAEIATRVAELLALVGLADHADKYPAQLSGGQQQRVALARAIAISPGLLLLDEPLSALDAKVRVHLRHEMKELQRKLGVTTIMVTHDQEEALAMADRIVVMNHGVIEQIGTPTEIYRDPASLFVADFIGETNRIRCRYSDGAVTIGGSVLHTRTAGHRDGADVMMAIRPEDVLPHSTGHDAVKRPNHLAAQVTGMEFLGSFWRMHLRSAELGDTPLLANFSMNAVRRFDLHQGDDLTVELPPDRVLIFAQAG